MRFRRPTKPVMPSASDLMSLGEMSTPEWFMWLAGRVLVAQDSDFDEESRGECWKGALLTYHGLQTDHWPEGWLEHLQDMRDTFDTNLLNAVTSE